MVVIHRKTGTGNPFNGIDIGGPGDSNNKAVVPFMVNMDEDK